MATARFSQIVAQCGKPEAYLVWSKPEDDPTFQNQLKSHRVMTVHQQFKGGKKDFGQVGYEAASGAQYLIFPKSLRAYADKKIVGIDYDLLAPPPKSAAVMAPARPSKPVPPRPPRVENAPKEKPVVTPAPAPELVPEPKPKEPAPERIKTPPPPPPEPAPKPALKPPLRPLPKPVLKTPPKPVLNETAKAEIKAALTELGENRRDAAYARLASLLRH